jgi:hypothetical protein
MNDMLEDLSRMYRLFSRITDGLVPISDIFRYGDDYIDDGVRDNAVMIIIIIIYSLDNTFWIVEMRRSTND